MNEPAPRPPFPRWLGGAVLVLLGCQTALLWMQGSLLERQHGELAALRRDIQDLAETFDAYTGGYDGGANGSLSPSRRAVGPGRHPYLRVRLQEGEKSDGVAKELADQRKSEKEAVAKARDVREKLSIEENARKAEEKARQEAETHKLRPLVWIGVVVALGALFLRSWSRNRG